MGTILQFRPRQTPKMSLADYDRVHAQILYYWMNMDWSDAEIGEAMDLPRLTVSRHLGGYSRDDRHLFRDSPYQAAHIRRVSGGFGPSKLLAPPR